MDENTEELTREQADERLLRALEAVIRLGPGETGRPAVTTAYLCIVAQQAFTDDGDGMTGISTIFGPGGSIPDHVALGLVETAKMYLKAPFYNMSIDEDD